MAEQKILISIKINDREAANTQKQLKVTKDNFDSLTDAEKAKIVADKQLVLSAKELDKALTLQAKSANNAAAATEKGRTQSGLNNAILLETGRLASDASFGFTAIANNLSQVVTLFSSFAKTNGGVIASLKELGNSLLGTGGLLILVQLLISYGADLMKIFASTSAEAVKLKDVFKDAGSAVQETAGRFQTYIATLQDANASQEKQAKALELLNKEFPDYVKQLKQADVSIENVKNQTAEATEQNVLYEESIRRIARSKAAQSAIEEESAAEIQATLETERILRQKYNMTLKEAEEATKIYNEELKNGQTVSAGTFGSTTMTNTAINRQSENIKVLVRDLKLETDQRKKNIQILEDYVILGNKGIDGKPRERDFKQQLLNLDKLEESYRQKSIDQTLLTEDEKINAQEKFAKAELKIRLDQFNKRQKLRLDEFLESKASDDEKLQAQKDYNESIALAQQEHDDVMIELKASYETKRSKLERKRAERSAAETQKARETQRQIEEQALEDLKTFDTEANTLFFEANANFIQRLLDRQIAIIDSEHSTADQIATARKEQFDLLAQLRQNDLNQELAAIEAKKAVNLEYTGFAASIGSTLSNLAGENEALAKAALVVEKGAAIAKVIITAQTAIAAKTASANSVAAFLPPFGSPNPAYFLAQAEAKKSNLRTKVGAALSIANILSTMIGKKGGAKDTSGGGDGGGLTIQAPDFNVVGASQVSQLAETVAGQQSKPVKAFVVGKDISTQQELDRNITNTASFG
jgi:hypothetical protein